MLRSLFPHLIDNLSSRTPSYLPKIFPLNQYSYNSGNNDTSTSKNYLKYAFMLSGIAGSLYLANIDSNEIQACGIIAMIGSRTSDNVLPYLLEGLNILQNRGYDAAGVATLNSNKKDSKYSIVTTKFASSAQKTSDSLLMLQNEAPKTNSNSYIGIAHTRWATHGGKTDKNAHPHSDYKSRIAIVHNGTIQNCTALKNFLKNEYSKDKSFSFKSETDTEVIAQLIGFFLDKGHSFVESTKNAINMLEGTWGLAIINKDNPDIIIAARHGSPLIIGIDREKTFIASELSAFSRYTNQYIQLHDDEIVVIKKEGVSELNLLERVETNEYNETIALTPDPYPHWTLKEIIEQPESISRCLNFGGRLHPSGEVKLGGLEANISTLMNINNLIIAACGTSHYASLYGAQLMRHLLAFDTVQPIDAAEFTPDIIPVKNPGILVISQSGETKDVHRCVSASQSMNVPVFSVVNSVGSLIARTTQCGVYTNAGREHAVASTKAFVTQITVLALIASWFSQNRPGYTNTEDPTRTQRRNELLEAIHRLPTYSGMTLTSRNICKKVAHAIKDKQHLFVLGKGFGEPIAKEGALKIKEITYIHAEGFPGGALKHGPFALIEDETPIILLILDDENAQFMRTAAHEVRGRGAKTIVITDNPKLAEDVSDFVIPIPANGPLTALLSVIPLQLIAYELAILRGIDPDKPKNLAKAVTVD